MIVALDATPLTLSSGGLRRYTEELARALAAGFPDDQILLASDQAFALPRTAPPNLTPAGAPRNWLERRWWLWGLPRELRRRKAHIFHGTNFAAPYFAVVPSVLSLHDLSPWMDPTWHGAAERVRRRTPLMLRRAAMVLTDSEAGRRQAMDRFGIPPGRIAAVPLAAAAHLRPVEAPAAAPFFLYLGTLEPRKNLAMLLEAWRHLRQRHAVELVLAGRRRADFPALPEEPGLRIVGEVAEEKLPALYSGAVACLYPSFYEGFGLPVLEAMQCGSAVIASRDAALSEVAGGAAIQLDAGDTLAWAQAMRAALEQPEWLANWRRKALERAREFSWARTARLTREVYEEARRLAAGA
ncbi:MAG: glycosyltransferase family 4 protein [Acidobacteria bacterium]|nr:glycosyltransferase family 4 protein [Acidobacteriota bacterium]